MSELCNLAVVRSLLEKYDCAPKKGYGQNFLINPHVPMRIAELSASYADPSKPAGVLEIGPGVGALTQYLCQHYDKVVAVEIDHGLIPLLAESLAEYDNVTVVESDFMQIDLPAFLREHFGDILDAGGTVGVCANLPYYITTPVIMKLLESFPMTEKIPLTSITVMVQLEVARRLAAKAGSADYGSISAAIALRADTEKLLDVSAGNFLPVPKVASAVVGIVPHGGIRQVYPDAPADEEACAAFAENASELITLAFGQRRKTLVNSIGTKYPKDKTTAVLEEIGIRPDIRGEKLSAEDFCRIADYLNRN
ncbi:MAG: ribosomal RNA small subunit methyltransferase A [Clostridia bacterium]|nr:ribosomal RNA small subunit methyltransferase A [Clostridia bacterium]MBQ8370805.1 ribosomal RNA small subunit methyltransferase A [Clostridia bacterium]MBQ8512333.1 ribosomal RNA small subunit methyltransferase A [Clostridia bacterium]